MIWDDCYPFYPFQSLMFLQAFGFRERRLLDWLAEIHWDDQTKLDIMFRVLDGYG